MPAPYNLTNITDGNSTVEIVQTVNTMTNGWFGILFAISIFAVILIYISFYNFGVAFMAASFLTAILTSYLYYVELVPLIVPIFSIVFVFIGVLILKIFYEA